ncbi:MAG TPA: ATP-binding protein [Candidatus Aquilonibacter sp.]|nr:ATP-binding protein [Candidatus Aquilonibacter sp.]
MTRQRSARTISGRITRMNLLVSGSVLVLAVLAFFSYDMLSFRQNLISNLSAEAQIIGANSVAALTFDDPASAEATLRGLSRSPGVAAAVLTTEDGSVFATYGPSRETALITRHVLPLPETEHHWLEGRHLVLAHRIVYQKVSLGVIYIAAPLTEIEQRARHYLLIAVLILLFCMVAAIGISSASRRTVAQPITSLAETVRSISRERDYSARAAQSSDNVEMAVLTKAFNEMLEQIQERDAALRRSRDELEQRVEERTVELRSANRELEAFSYTVAHDLRGPLDSIAGLAYLLATNADRLDPTSREMLQRLQDSTKNMAALIDDLLNFSRASTSAVKRDEVNLTTMAHQIATDLKSSEPGRDVDFNISDLPPVEADAGLMRIVVDNLLRNAWKYTSHHPKACIEFGAKIMSDSTVYFVRDDGAGFDPRRTGEMFQPFHRLHSKSEFHGTGIGLATVQRIIARHGGAIWAEGNVERGATFYFTLPQTT